MDAPTYAAARAAAHEALDKYLDALLAYSNALRDRDGDNALTAAYATVHNCAVANAEALAVAAQYRHSR